MEGNRNILWGFKNYKNSKKNQNLVCKNNEIEIETLEQIADEREREREITSSSP